MFEKVSATTSESSSPNNQPDEPAQNTATEESNTGISPLIVGAIVALILAFAAFASWLVLKGRKK
ncbi:hypothetical protein ACMG4H_10930 [Corynebacterium glutamicum]|uniref:hypothetical protein n=1 Tax=Corynebacterium glutamicum TaxID=1718 RepID=UPI003C7A3220